MLGEIIVVELAEVETLIHEEQPAKNRTSATWKQLNEVHFSSLWAILLGVPDSEEYESKIKVITSNDGEIWIVVLPMELTELIAAQKDKEFEDIVTKWSATDEFKWGWTENDVKSLLNDLIKLAVEAKEKGKSLIYWGTL